MIDQKEGETGFAVKIHYDDMVNFLTAPSVVHVHLTKKQTTKDKRKDRY